MLYKQDYFGFIYKWTNNRNKKYYIGSHLGSTDDGYIGSGIWFKRAFDKEPHRFSREILTYLTVDDPIRLLEIEQEYLIDICEVGIKSKCYNISRKAGGGFQLYGKTVTEIAEVYAKISNTLKNKSVEERNWINEKMKMTIAAAPEKYKEAIEKSKASKRNWTPERKELMIARQKETVASRPEIQEQAKKKRQNKLDNMTPEEKAEYGKKWSKPWTVERREKHKQALKNKKETQSAEDKALEKNNRSLTQKNRDPNVSIRAANTFKNRSAEEKLKSYEKWINSARPGKEAAIQKMKDTKRKQREQNDKFKS